MSKNSASITSIASKKAKPTDWSDFAWTSENAARAEGYVARYPQGRQRSAILALLDLAQRQVGEMTQTQGWLPVPVIEYVAGYLAMPYIRAYEVATFYSMYNLQPVGRFHIQLCGTTPCMLCGASEVMRACNDFDIVKGQTTADGLFTLSEVECIGNCANAPVVQINDDNYEDLNYERMAHILTELSKGNVPKAGTQNPNRRYSDPEGGVTSLAAMVDANHDYRKEWAVPNPTAKPTEKSGGGADAR